VLRKLLICFQDLEENKMHPMLDDLLELRADYDYQIVFLESYNWDQAKNIINKSDGVSQLEKAVDIAKQKVTLYGDRIDQIHSRLNSDSSLTSAEKQELLAGIKKLRALKSGYQADVKMYSELISKKQHTLDGSETHITMGDHSHMPEAVLATAVAAASIYAGYKIYKRFFSAAARACKGKGSEREKCLKAYRIKALQNAISKMKETSGKCSKTKDPSKCKNKINSQIEKYSARLRKAQG
jgi:hypothetical protein